VRRRCRPRRGLSSKMTSMKVAHYIRISTEEQKKGYSTSDQRRRLDEHSERESHEVVERIVEEGDSGANPFRAGIQRILELAEAGEIEAVWSTKRDRLFRRRLYRLQLEEDLRDLGVRLRSLDDTGSRFVDAIKDEYAEEEREVIRDRTRAGRIERAKQGEVVAGIPPYGFRFTPDRKNFEVEEGEAVVVRKIFSMAASGTSLNGIASALEREGVPTPRGERGARGSGDGHTWSRAVLRQMVLSDCYLPHSRTDLEALVESGNLDRVVLERLSGDELYGVWWYNRERVEVRYKDGGRTRRFEANPREAWVAVPIPHPGTPKEHVDAARRSVLNNRAHSSAGRRFWELSGGILYCPCGRRMATHTAPRKGDHDFYYVCGLRRSGSRRCGHGVRYHRAGEIEQKVRALVLGFLSQPEEVRRRAEEYVESERGRLSRLGRELSGWEGRLTDAERRRSALIDLAADGTITREDLRIKLAELHKEREACREEIRVLREGSEELDRLEGLPELAESLARDLPYFLDSRRVVREYETSAPERSEDGGLPLYTLTPERIRHLPEEEVERREREAEDERAARYRAMYEDLGLRVVAHPDGTLEASWRFGEAVLRKVSDTSQNKHATKHFHSTGHPIIRSFEPGEDWRWCYVDEMLV
jgi:site-specific DNA recombinase